jgi:phosphatidylinositol glycan class S
MWHGIISTLLPVPLGGYMSYLFRHCVPSVQDIDNLLMLLTIEKLTLAKNSLISLVELLDDVKNMVISDHIQQEVVESLNQINQCRERMMKMDWESAHIAADKAFHHAETAFFDPSILALLYFPDDQKYAIYVPLFVPISIPILRSLIKFIRSMKRT